MSVQTNLLSFFRTNVIESSSSAPAAVPTVIAGSC